ncbi:peroxidase 70-like [Phragmites australis]|uniref:peroxidase 70-like n=1 Tax=Phragmites australis TaxID=29695 RepID=UPI002D7921F6|nr:peroxidase 70-like [Phragmites australis]
MASSTTSHCLLVALFLLSSAANSQLTPSFYASSCPALEYVVSSAVNEAIAADRRMGASLLRLFFHDCFVQGCDASILLDDVGSFVGEKTAFPNVNSVRGYDVINKIKIDVEANCSGVVSCADIVALAARDGTVLLGGPNWDVPLGRRDSTTANLTQANSDLPSPGSDLSTLVTAFGNKGLSPRDLTALSGAHTIGFAQCNNFRDRIYNDSDIDTAFAEQLQANCSSASGSTNGNLAALDEQTQLVFDNAFYANLAARRGLLHSDQELFNGGSQDALVQDYSADNALFFADFAAAMINLGNISPLTGTDGQIRANCSVVN